MQTTRVRALKTQPPAAKPDVRSVAVIDIGSTALRMAVAEITGAGDVRPLEVVSRAVNLGRDAFTTGGIKRSTTEACVEILQDFKRVLEEYRITGPDQLRVVGTTAVREAENGLGFIDRIHIATGMRIEPIDDAEVHRLTYLAILPLLKPGDEGAGPDHTLVVEVGGGTTTTLLLNRADVVFSHTYRLGSQRLRELLKVYDAPVAKADALIQNHVQRTVDRVRRDVRTSQPIRILALGGDARFAASWCDPEWRSRKTFPLPRQRLEKLVDIIMPMSADDLVAAHRLTYPEAETLGPALLTYFQLAQMFDVDEITVSTANLRDGLLTEMAVEGTWTAPFASQIVRSALELGRRYRFNEPHALHTAELASKLFDFLQPEHGLDPRFELLLRVAALLHDIGSVVGPRSHHKHSMYLILNSDLFGLGQKDLLLVALVARYHRRATPKPLHEGYSTLDDESRIAVAKLAAILHVADALDRSETQRIREITCERESDQFIITVSGVEDLSLEELALQQKGALFRNVFGRKVVLRTV